MAGDETVEYFGSWEVIDDPEALPTDGTGQSCAICGAEAVQWLHALAKELVEFSVHGEGCTLPSFWALCAECEALHLAGDETAITSRMAQRFDEPFASDLDLATLAAFGRADRGGRAFGANERTS
jgi:hypothetical protein